MLAKLRGILPGARHEELKTLSDSQLGKMAALLQQMGAISDDERRTHSRRAVISRVQVVASAAGKPRSLAGVQQDSSLQGASIVVAKPIGVGTRVRVVQRNNVGLDGMVRNCHRSSSGWVLGIEYDHAAQNRPSD